MRMPLDKLMTMMNCTGVHLFWCSWEAMVFMGIPHLPVSNELLMLPCLLCSNSGAPSLGNAIALCAHCVHVWQNPTDITFFWGQAMMSCRSLLITRHSRNLSESRIRAAQCYDCPTKRCDRGHYTQ